ncbi:hypothetical protein SUDANB25_04101 [Streptomyces sp. SudanB25_2051]
MPFLAQGGSSVVTNWIMVALLVRVSHSARAPGPDDDPDGEPAADGHPSVPGPDASATPPAPQTPAAPLREGAR